MSFATCLCSRLAATLSLMAALLGCSCGQLPAAPIAAEAVAASASGSSDPHLRAISLAGLGAALKTCQENPPCPKSLLELEGVKLLTGLVFDEESEDIILLGETDPGAPVLRTEDLAVALRNAWLRYARVRGNTRIYSRPGCTIDPRPGTLERLQTIALKLSSPTSSEAVDTTIRREWNEVCQEQQTVQVFGIPHDTRFAKVMVEADHRMKRLVDGSEDVSLPGFEGLTDALLAKAKQEALSGRVSIQVNLNRFWFYPGENVYEEQDGVVWIKRCRVSLLTEQRYLGRRGETVGSGRAEPLAGEFAKNFTRRFQEIAESIPVYARLENLFRFVAVAQILKHKPPPGDGLDYFLHEYPVPEEQVVRTLPGLPSLKKAQVRRDFPGGYQEIRFWLPSCGGVDIAIDISSGDLRPHRRGVLAGLRRRVLGSRPSSTAVSWRVGSPSLAHIRRVRANNIPNRTAKTYVLTYLGEPGEYVVTGEAHGEIFRGVEMENLLEAVREDSEALKSNEQTVYLLVTDLERRRLEALKTTLSAHSLNPENRVRILGVEGSDNQAKDLYFVVGVQMGQISGPEAVQTGARKGLYHGAIEFLRGVKSFTLNVYGTSGTIVQEFLSRMRVRFSVNVSVADIANQVRYELHSERNLSIHDLILELVDEFGNINIVEFLPLHQGPDTESTVERVWNVE